jgi:hypothetical protein
MIGAFESKAVNISKQQFSFNYMWWCLVWCMQNITDATIIFWFDFNARLCIECMTLHIIINIVFQGLGLLACSGSEFIF